MQHNKELEMVLHGHILTLVEYIETSHNAIAWLNQHNKLGLPRQHK